MRFAQSIAGMLALALLIVFTPRPPVFAQSQPSPMMSFFITSEGLGKGADLGGLEGADAHCGILAARVGGDPSKNWRAYLSTTPMGQLPSIEARNRIGTGPWYNAKGVMIAKSVDDLHSANNKINKENALTEKGTMVNGRGDNPNMHDILTGSDAQGRAIAKGGDTTCHNWTSQAGDGSARVGHFDRTGGGDDGMSWNSAHASKGCSQANLVSTGGAGLFYCFVAN